MSNRPSRPAVRGPSVHHREMDTVERGGVVEELGMVEDQAMTSANET